MKNKKASPAKDSDSPAGPRKIDELASDTYSWWRTSFALIHKRKIKSWKAIFIIAFFAGAVAATVWTVSLNIQRSTFAAGQAVMMLDPADDTVAMGDEFDMDIVLDTNETNVVAAKAVIVYNPINFELIGWDTSQSSFAAGNTCIYQEKPCEIIDNQPQQGRITITVAKPSPGVNSSSATIGTLTFKALSSINPSSDNFTVSFSRTGAYDDSDVIEDDGNGTDILFSVENSRISVTAPTCVDFTYTEWGDCQIGGIQLRSVLSYIPDGCSGGNPVIQQSCSYEPPVCESFTYSEWSECQPNETRTRTMLSSSPAGCTGGTPEPLEESCELPPGETCTDFTFTDWSTCQPNGTQSRSVISRLPENCTGGDPLISQNCDYIIPTCTDFAYGEWSSCNQEGLRFRELISSSPAGCTGGQPDLEESCEPSTPTCTSYEYSDWGNCQVNGVQVRTIIRANPTGCNGGVAPVLTQNCQVPDPGPETPICSAFQYSDWSPCQTNGIKVRSVTISTPQGCAGGTPILESTCDYASNTPAKKDKDEDKKPSEPKFTNLPKFLTKRPGDKVWWKVEKPWRIDYYQYTFNGKKIKTKKASFNVPLKTESGTYRLKVKAVNESGGTKSRTIWIRVR